MSGRVVLLTGYRGCGKSSVAAAMAAHGWRHVSLGDLIRDRARGYGLNAHDFGDLLRKQQGADAVARLVEDIVMPRSPQKLVLDGIYTHAELIWLRQYFQCPTTLIGLMVDDDARRRRLRQRGRQDDAPATLELLEQRQLKLDIGSLLNEADFAVNNDGPLTATLDEICRFLEGQSS